MFKSKLGLLSVAVATVFLMNTSCYSSGEQTPPGTPKKRGRSDSDSYSDSYSYSYSMISPAAPVKKRRRLLVPEQPGSPMNSESSYSSNPNTPPELSGKHFIRRVSAVQQNKMRKERLRKLRYNKKNNKPINLFTYNPEIRELLKSIGVSRELNFNETNAFQEVVNYDRQQDYNYYRRGTAPPEGLSEAGNFAWILEQRVINYGHSPCGKEGT
ncbi:MAG: hypothetical protein ABFQ95_05030 [Pseudomonadota bacterium]